jgi:type I restriction enzyme M protein
MVEMMAPGPDDEICDPACGTAGFLVAAAQYVARIHKEALLAPAQRQHYNQSMFHGFDFDSTMLRIASMNMLLHEVEQPDIRYRDSLAQNVADEAERYSMILANPPFSGSLDVNVQVLGLAAAVRDGRLRFGGGRGVVVVAERGFGDDPGL